MKFNPLLNAITRGAWAVHPAVAEMYLPVVGRVLNGEVGFHGEDATTDLPSFVAGGRTFGMSNWTDFDNVPEGSTAVIPVSGPIMKNSQSCGPTGTQTIAA